MKYGTLYCIVYVHFVGFKMYYLHILTHGGEAEPKWEGHTNVRELLLRINIKWPFIMGHKSYYVLQLEWAGQASRVWASSKAESERTQIKLKKAAHFKTKGEGSGSVLTSVSQPCPRSQTVHVIAPFRLPESRNMDYLSVPEDRFGEHWHRLIGCAVHSACLELVPAPVLPLYKYHRKKLPLKLSGI